MAIVGYAQAASRASPRPLNDPLNGIMTTVERGQRLTRRLLSVSRKHPVRPERLSLTSWSSHVDLLRSAVGEGVDVNDRFESCTIWIRSWYTIASADDLWICPPNAFRATERTDRSGTVTAELSCYRCDNSADIRRCEVGLCQSFR